MAPLDLDACLEKIKKCEHLPEEDLKAVCEYVRSPTQAGSHAHRTLCASWSLLLLVSTPGERRSRRSWSRRAMCSP